MKKVFKIFGRVKYQQAMLLMILCLVLRIDNCNSQTLKAVPSRQSASEAFSKGDFEQAFNDYSYLLKTYSKDPLYKYYSGVCLVKLNRDPETALLLLEQAHQGSAVVRSVPSDAVFWLGRAQQMTGRFDEAITSFDAFTLQYGKKAARDLDIPAYVQQCHDRKGRMDDSEIQPVAEKVKEIKPDEQVEEIVEPEVNDVPVASQNNDTLPGNFDLILSEALELQFKLRDKAGFKVPKKNTEYFRIEKTVVE